jgi:hypothetical protein
MEWNIPFQVPAPKFARIHSGLRGKEWISDCLRKNAAFRQGFSLHLPAAEGAVIAPH